MKTKSILFGLLALALAGLFIITNKAPAQGNSRQPHSIIFLSDEDMYHRGPNNEYIVDGLKIAWFEADQYAPAISKGDRLADTIAKCMDLGYIYERTQGRGHLLIR